MNDTWDCLVIGGGPAGLTAAVYLGRFRRRVLVIDAGCSRTGWIPRSHNLAGFPEGIAGSELLDRLRDQATLYGAQVRPGSVERLARDGDGGFTATLADATLRAATVVLATGVVENPPPAVNFADAVKSGVIRTCPICDGFEGIDKRIAVLGAGAHAAAEAQFLRSYTAQLTLLLVDDPAALPVDTRRQLDAGGIAIRAAGSESVTLQADGVTAMCADDGQMHRFDIVYSAFGTTAQSVLARLLGARMDDDGRLFVDAQMATSVPGLYAAGDLVRGLNQISIAAGEAAIAATAVHNFLPKIAAAPPA